jgi:arsenate reductase
MTTLYGIPNCDTVRKARAWLAEQGIAVEFHDFKKAGVSAELIQTWLKDIPWDTLVNRKGTTWRGLPDQLKAAVVDAGSATALMLEHPSVIKRPVLRAGARTAVGFSEQQYREIFKK